MSDTVTPPCPDGVPILGNGYAFSRDPVAAMERWAEYGDIVKLTMPGRTIHLVTDPALVEEILVGKQEKFTIGPAQREFFSGVEDHAMTTATGDRWKRLRSAAHPAFTRPGIEGYGDRMASRTAAYVEQWAEGDRIDLNREMRLLTVRILADTLLGVDIEGEEEVVMTAADAIVDRADFRRPGLLLPDWIPTPTDRRFERAVRALDDFVDGVLADRRADRDTTDGGADDVCSVLLAAHERGDLSGEEVRHNLVAMMLAGHESPATALTSALHLLSDHPDVGESLVAEHERVVGNGLPGTATVESLERTRHVVAETLRLYPPTLAVNRQSTGPVTLGDYEFPAGAQFMLAQWVLHRDERFWVDPGTFDPDRWQGESDRPDYAYFPFSGGPRQCIGSDFARLELTLALATMVARVDLAVHLDGPLSFRPSIQLRPDADIEATVRRR